MKNGLNKLEPTNEKDGDEKRRSEKLTAKEHL
jgi:hypothetical protein